MADKRDSAGVYIPHSLFASPNETVKQGPQRIAKGLAEMRKRCKEPTCNHAWIKHSRAAGCLAVDVDGYPCACHRFQREAP